MTCNDVQLFAISGWIGATALMLIVVFAGALSISFRDRVRDKLTNLWRHLPGRNR